MTWFVLHIAKAQELVAPGTAGSHSKVRGKEGWAQALFYMVLVSSQGHYEREPRTFYLSLSFQYWG